MAMEKGFEKESHFGRILRPVSIVDDRRIPRSVVGVGERPGANDGPQQRRMRMKRTMARYKAKPEHAEENERLIRKVFEELRTKSPDGVRYLVLRLADGTFVHFSTADTEDGVSPIPRLEAFGRFQSGIKERCIEPPQSSDVTIVGEYRVLGE
jgi:hypothetical protein